MPTSREGADKVRALLQNAPPWLSKRLDKYCEDPARFEKPSSAAVAADAFGGTERWREVVPLIEAGVAPRYPPQSGVRGGMDA